MTDPTAPSCTSVDEKTFQKFRDLIYEKCGITLRPGKEGLVAARVGSRMRELGIPTHRQYYDWIVSDTTGQELVLLIDAISTNVTSFFREEDHFQILEKLLRQWASEGQTRFRIWSAASSTGEEPYTIAMVAHSVLHGVPNLDLKILATDISTKVLLHCKRGQYDEMRVRPVPSALLRRYFKIHSPNEQPLYEVCEELKNLISFSRINLSTPPFPMKGPFDIVFCRNVMIYFDNPVRMGLLNEIHRLLKPGGALMLGHAESLSGLPLDFKSLRASTYVKPTQHTEHPLGSGRVLS